MKIEEIAEWWKNASTTEREDFLSLLGDDAYPVSERTWYIHPVRDDDE